MALPLGILMNSTLRSDFLRPKATEGEKKIKTHTNIQCVLLSLQGQMLYLLPSKTNGQTCFQLENDSDVFLSRFSLVVQNNDYSIFQTNLDVDSRFICFTFLFIYYFYTISPKSTSHFLKRSRNT